MRPEFLDGAAVVRWLEDEGHRLSKSTLNSRISKIHDWRAGEFPCVYDVDKVLTKLDLHVDMLPDDLWVEDPEYVEELAA